jgi:Amt family ammonium transporter
MMMPTGLSDGISMLACLLLILISPLALAGMALMNTGLGRARSASHSMVSSLVVVGAAAIVYCVVGFSLQGFAGGAGYFFVLDGKPWDWIGHEPWLMRGLHSELSQATLTALLQIISVGLAALIPLSAGADRWRMRAIVISTALLAGFVYPLFAHWVWGGGWLSKLGANYGLGSGFVDAGGASTIHVVGGLSALVITWILGPRRGKYAQDGMVIAIPGHNIVYVVLGCLLVLPGWVGLNAAGAILFAGRSASDVPLIAINSLLAAGASCLMAMGVTRFRFGKPDASLSANGWVAGLVTSSALSAFVSPLVAIGTGMVAGALVPLTVELLELKLGVDDPGGAIPVHGVAGIWGLLAFGLFAALPNAASGGSSHGQLMAQVIGVATLLGVVFPMIYGLNWLVNRVHPLRVDAEGDRLGMDLHELGAGAFPEFVVHSDEFIPR